MHRHVRQGIVTELRRNPLLRCIAAVSAPVKVLLPRRSLQLQTGDVRYNWQHAILNADLLAPRRVSITFRQEKLPGST